MHFANTYVTNFTDLIISFLSNSRKKKKKKRIFFNLATKRWENDILEIFYICVKEDNYTSVNLQIGLMLHVHNVHV